MDAAVPADVRMLLTGKMGAGKSYAALYLESAHGAVRWSRTELMKRLAHAVANGAGSPDDVLNRLFSDEDERNHVRDSLFHYIVGYQEEPGKPRKLYQEITDICQEYNPLCFEVELANRIDAAAGGEASKFSLVDDVRILPAFEYFNERGFVTVRITAPDDVCRSRMLRRDGYLPDEAAFSHISETELDGVTHEYVIDNSSANVRDLYAKLDQLVIDVSSAA